MSRVQAGSGRSSVERIRSGVCRRNRFVLSSELKPGVNMLAKRYPQGRSAGVGRIAPKRLGLALILIILGLGFAGHGCHSQKNSAGPSIEFTHVPPAAQGGKEKLDTISGRVSNARPKQQIVIYAHSGLRLPSLPSKRTRRGAHRLILDLSMLRCWWTRTIIRLPRWMWHRPRAVPLLS